MASASVLSCTGHVPKKIREFVRDMSDALPAWVQLNNTHRRMARLMLELQRKKKGMPPPPPRRVWNLNFDNNRPVLRRHLEVTARVRTLPPDLQNKIWAAYDAKNKRLLDSFLGALRSRTWRRLLVIDSIGVQLQAKANSLMADDDDLSAEFDSDRLAGAGS